MSGDILTVRGEHPHRDRHQPHRILTGKRQFSGLIVVEGSFGDAGEDRIPTACSPKRAIRRGTEEKHKAGTLASPASPCDRSRRNTHRDLAPSTPQDIARGSRRARLQIAVPESPEVHVLLIVEPLAFAHASAQNVDVFGDRHHGSPARLQANGCTFLELVRHLRISFATVQCSSRTGGTDLRACESHTEHTARSRSRIADVMWRKAVGIYRLLCITKPRRLSGTACENSRRIGARSELNRG